ncbi:MAG: RND transporter [Verrucomicrobia bacterium]|nr:MAG: RND transporter [Verrucomicrobiota bacterium]
MNPTSDSLAVRVLRWLSNAVYRYPRLFFYPQLLLFIASLFVTAVKPKIQFDTSRDDLVGAEKQYHKNYLRYKKEFLAQDELVAVVESEDTEKNRQFVERLGERLIQETNLFTDVIYNNDVTMLGDKALLFFPEKDLKELLQTLRDYRPFIQQFVQATNLNSLFRLVNHQFGTARREENAENRALAKALPAMERIISQASDSLQRPGTPPSPGLTALFNAGKEAEQQIYVTFADGRIYIVTARPRRDDLNDKAVQRLRELVAQTKAEVPGINVGITGEPVLEYDEMAQSQHDTVVATIVSLVLVALIFVYGYNESGRPIKATICLIVGLAYTMAFATLVIGHLNILTITFLPMLVGLAIDFGVHLVTRYEEELRQGKTEPQALGKAVVYTGQGIFTGCFTTAGAFLAMALTDFKGIREMGIISGGGLLICLVPMMTLLPLLLLRGRQNVLDHTFPREIEKRARLEKMWLERPLLVTGITAGLCLVSLVKAGRVPFDYNLLHMQSKDLPAVVFEQKLIDSANQSVLYCAVIAKSLPEALALEAKITNLTAVGSVDSMARYLTEDQAGKLGLVGEVKEELAPIRFAELDDEPVNVPELSATLWYLQGYVGFATTDIEKENDGSGNEENKEVLDNFKLLDRAITQLRRRMLEDPQLAAKKLAAFQLALFNDIRETFGALKTQDNRGPLRAEDLPPALRHRFVSKSGDLFLLQVYPKKDVWQRQNQEEFVNQLRNALDPRNTGTPIITGTPVQLLEYTTLLKNSYEQAAWYSLAAIAFLVFVHFRSTTCVILSLLPVGVGTIWMVGFMGWFDIPFNPANIMTLPLVIGIGVTSGIHILNRFAEERKPSILAKSTGKAVFVSALTTIVGFGSLMLAKHQGIASLGCVMAVGTTTCMVAALTFLPAILNLLSHRGWVLGNKKPSDDNAQSTLGREEPR